MSRNWSLATTTPLLFSVRDKTFKTSLTRFPEENKLLSWGYNKNGQLGLGHNNHVSTPTELPAIEGHKILDVVCGPLQTWVISENLKTGSPSLLQNFHKSKS